MMFYSLVLVACCLFGASVSFTATKNLKRDAVCLTDGSTIVCFPSLGVARLRPKICLSALPDEKVDNQQEQEDEGRPKLDVFLEKKYPRFYSLVNEEMTKAFKQGQVTVFVPNDAAFQDLGEKKLKQIEDPRNEEIKEKMGSYHVVPSAISAIELRTEDWTRGKPKDGSKPNTLIAGLKTLSGEVPVGRSKSGGFLGFGATEDGDIVIGPAAKIVQSFEVEGSFVHEVDSLVSPLILWRYCDQLRIPGF